ncbi:hypothetical protein GGR21_000207 [Dysgonomonas hofstadii]|uniref:Lipoprotein n=1 Tax=Dysgonomonas hofstadii TaxID=637886 RepID=A0A840CP21_9BACT|nr:hypothetical protein [Dysgonomonas hofstadii]MBB4034322.1 hypothetical protein [Dysgonomonas hofstadii]
MKNGVFLIICIIFILSGCGSSKSTQPESMYKIMPVNNTPQQQLLNYFTSLDKKGELAVTNPYRLEALSKLIDSNSDTIIYYESISAPSNAIGYVHYSCTTFESHNQHTQSYVSDRISTVTKNMTVGTPLLQRKNIRSVKLDSVPTNTSNKMIVEIVKEDKQEQLLIHNKTPKWIGSISHGNMLVVAVKVGGIYKFKSYKNISFRPKGIIHVESLQIDSIG